MSRATEGMMAWGARQLLAAAVTATLLSPQAAVARDDYSDGWGSDVTSDYAWTAERISDNRIASAEEQAREAGRENRREEVAREKDAASEEYLASRAEALEKSRAALGRPRDAYYRMPGWISEGLPESSVKVELGGVVYHYDRGTYLRQAVEGRYIVVPAPAGADIERLPFGYSVAVNRTDPARLLYYYFGSFYEEKDKRFRVVKPPVGTVVGYLPDGYAEQEEGDKRYFEFGGVRYQQAMYYGKVVFMVIGMTATL